MPAPAEVIVGVNKYRLQKEDDIDLLVVNNETVRSKQVAKLKEVGKRAFVMVLDFFLDFIYLFIFLFIFFFGGGDFFIYIFLYFSP